MKKVLKKPLENDSGLGIVDASIYLVLSFILMYLFVFHTAELYHEAVTYNYDKVAQSYVDAIQQNREITPEMDKHFQQQIAKFDWYAKKNIITYKKVNYSTGNSTVLATSGTGKHISKITLAKHDIIRVEISSAEDTMLTKVYKIYGGTSVAKVVGYAEGSVD